ncbi:protein of unknown function [Roseateles sp. YR242]|uniref:DUF4337 domain-containing protein n=1 Tax=Roseateles sp. YR242 TaxID=1855305 RepID=UPI0008BE02E2|nr:DUF4337 domain-containing protein [Roseateles sp. YR242]SEK84901.1 protein of unknown function [Roseateles sp. YR242]
MDIDPEELIENARQVNDLPPPTHRPGARLNATVAVTVAILATFMGICKVKDDNIVQAMQQAEANRIDHWAFYQARNMREEVAKATLVQLALQAQSAPASAAEGYQKAIAQYRALAEEQGRKKEELRQQAEADQQAYDAFNYRDDQFDLSDALLAIAIAMLAITALTQLWALYAAALVPTALGVVMGVAGLAGWALHPDAIVRLLS